MEWATSVLAVLLLLLVCLWRSRTSKKLPPGPWTIPIVGYLPFLTDKPYLEFDRLAKIYGNVFSIRLGNQLAVMLNDFHSIKEAFSQDAFIARPPEFSFQLSEETKKTGAFLGPRWKEQRRFSLRMLKDLGFGKTKMEALIQEEIDELLKNFEQKCGQPFSPRDLLSSSMSNNIASLVFGRRFAYDAPMRQKMNEFVDVTNNAAVQTSWKVFLPWLKTVLEILGIGEVSRVDRISKEGRAYLLKEIEDHEKTLDAGNVRDYIDGYLLEIRKRGNDPSFQKHVLLDMINAFFGAGSETVRLSVEWLLLLAGHHQRHQRRIQEEIDDVIGRDRPAIWQDQKSMPFTFAFIMEMQRWRTLVPVNLVRYTLSDAELDGYFIPKHTRILSNLWAVHHNPEHWGEDAEDFRPERFLSGSTLVKPEHYIPFSIGKRSCPGEPLANMEVFLYFTSILQRFNVRLPDGQEADFETVLGITLRPRVQNIVFTKRY